MMLLSGLTTPVETMPEALQVATLANPIRFGIDMVRRVYLEGAGLSTVWPDLLPLLLIAVATLPAAAWLFRNRLA
jgi:ABC-2 type transport system permease protein